MIYRCETCHHWQQSIAESNQGEKSPWGTCSIANTMAGITFVSLRNPADDTLAIFVTNKTFGCVQHPANKGAK